MARKFGVSAKTKVGNMVMKEFRKNFLRIVQEPLKTGPLHRKKKKRNLWRGDHNTSAQYKCSHKGNPKTKNYKWEISLGRSDSTKVLSKVNNRFKWFSNKRILQ